MDVLGSLADGFATILQPQYLWAAFLGVFLGTLIGVLPGIGPVAGITLLIPFTFGLDGVTTLVMLAGIYYGAQYGGSTTSILVNIPGESSSVITAIDGHEMARQGRAGPALAIAAIGSFVAGTVGIVFLMLLAPALVPVALSFGPAEDFGLMVLGLSLASLLSGGSIVKALISLMIGVLLAMVGLDPISAQPRFTFGSVELAAGIQIVALIVGLFGLAEVLSALEAGRMKTERQAEVGRLMPSREDARRSVGPIGRGTILGFLIGLLPGGGGIVSSLVSYGVEKGVSRHREEFGHGAIEGVAGPESANNAATTGAFVPLMTLGLPSNAVMAVILTALIVQGLQPGPRFIADNPHLFWTFIASMYVGNVVLLILNLPLVGVWASILRIPSRWLFPIVVMLVFVGVYSVNQSVFDLLVLVVAGALGYLMRRTGFPVAPLVLAFVLTPRMEQSFRQSLLISGGDPGVFFTGFIAPALIIAAALVILLGFAWPLFAARRSPPLLEDAD
jgi:putative tricarboxylic transport membrane protein